MQEHPKAWHPLSRAARGTMCTCKLPWLAARSSPRWERRCPRLRSAACAAPVNSRSEEHTSELQSLRHLVCRLLLEKKNTTICKPLMLPPDLAGLVHGVHPDAH